MPVLTGTEIFHSNSQTETATKTEYTTMVWLPTVWVRESLLYKYLAIWHLDQDTGPKKQHLHEIKNALDIFRPGGDNYC